MNVFSGDIIYVVLIAVTANVGYRVVRSTTMSFISKVVVMGGCLVFLIDFHHKFGWHLDTAHDWLWRIISPDRTMIAGAVIGLALALRNRYTNVFSEAGFVVQRMKVSAEADLARQRRELETDLFNQQQDAQTRVNKETQAKRKEFEREMREERELLEKKRRDARREQEEAMKEREQAKQGDPYEILGVTRHATPEEIRKRYRELMSQYHPDKATQTTPEIRKMAEEKVKTNNWAFERLKES